MTITWSDKAYAPLLEATPDLHVIAEVADGLQAVDVAEDQQTRYPHRGHDDARA
jgi:lactate dehydrogenase-like 2-hydroxyacid dehydrogenase